MSKVFLFTIFTFLSFKSISQSSQINLKKGLIAYLPLNGTTNDESGNNIDIVVKEAKPTTDRKNNSDFAYHFDGKSYIKLSKEFYGFNELTISLWFKTSNCSGDFQALISSTESGEFEHLQIHNNPTNSTNSGAFTNCGITTLACPSCYPIDKWRHLVLVCQSNNSKLYENGKIISSEKTTFSRINSTNTLLIGAGFKFQRFFNGEMEDVRIYNRALSGAEIEALYDGNQQSNEISYASTPQKKTATNISTEQQHEKNTKTKEEQETIAWQVKAYKKFQEEEAEREKKRNYKLENEKYLVQNKVKQGIVTTSTGLQYQILKKGTGGKSNMNNRVLVHYICKLIDGTIWDNSYQRNEELNISLKQVTKGWQEGILMMNEGAKYRFFIPYYLAYGEKGNGQTVPPYSTLICDVELIRSVVVDISDETASELDKILNSMKEDLSDVDLSDNSLEKKKLPTYDGNIIYGCELVSKTENINRFKTCTSLANFLFNNTSHEWGYGITNRKIEILDVSNSGSYNIKFKMSWTAPFYGESNEIWIAKFSNKDMVSFLKAIKADNTTSSSINRSSSSSSSSISSSDKCVVFMETKREESASYKNWTELKFKVNNEYGKLDYIDFYYDPTSDKYRTSVTIMDTSFDSLNDMMKYLMKLHYGCSTFKKDYTVKED